jgi:hypothetical protein
MAFSERDCQGFHTLDDFIEDKWIIKTKDMYIVNVLYGVHQEGAEDVEEDEEEDEEMARIKPKKGSAFRKAWQTRGGPNPTAPSAFLPLHPSSKGLSTDEATKPCGQPPANIKEESSHPLSRNGLRVVRQSLYRTLLSRITRVTPQKSGRVMRRMTSRLHLRKIYLHLILLGPGGF